MLSIDNLNISLYYINIIFYFDMLRYKYYDEREKTEHTWIDSSSIFYTKMVESPTDNKGDLYVTFKTGATYLYKDVAFEDYVLFIGGGTDFSQGKTLNKIIKPKYQVEKMEKGPTIQELNEQLETILKPKPIDNQDISA